MLRSEIKNFSGEGHSASPDPPQWGGDTRSPHPTPFGAFGALILAALDLPLCLVHF